MDPIKLIAYRAETALVQGVRERLQRADAAQALVCQVFQSAVDRCPEPERQRLRVRLHRLSRAIQDAALAHPGAELTATGSVFPGTEWGVILEGVGSSPLPRDQEA